METAPAASGTPAVAQLTQPLEAGVYQWQASAEDLLVAGTPLRSGDSGWRTFTVVSAPPNGAPGEPSLDAPVDGATFAHDTSVEFTVTATDPEGDSYVGEVTVTNVADPGDETTVLTEPASSGQPSSGSPVQGLEPGDYVWTARAVDNHGNSGPQAAPARAFTIDEPPPNAAPSTTLVTPANGHAYGANDTQTFTVNATDPEGDAYTAEVRVDGQVVCITPQTLSGINASCSPSPPIGAGSHTWEARSTDVNGNVESTWAGTRSFSVAANQAPSVPSPVEPADGYVFATGEDQVFTVEASDPDNDMYHAHVVVKQGTTTVAEFDTGESPPGMDSIGRPDTRLDPGVYTWTATAIDSKGNTSAAFSPARSFSVNRIPVIPTLVAPDDGHAFAQGDDQEFSVTTTDADGHPYRAEIVVRHQANGAEVLRFETPSTASGQTATASPPVDLPEGDYTWTATASDTRGGTSGESAPQSFSVDGPGVANEPPRPPTLVAPVDNTEHPYGDPDRFVVRATDPNEDPYTATITIWNATTDAVVATIEAGPAPSGSETSGHPPDFLAIGSYEWSAHATDLRGEPGDESGRASFTVVPADP